MSINSSSGAYSVTACISMAMLAVVLPICFCMHCQCMPCQACVCFVHSWLLLLSTLPSTGQSNANKHDIFPSQEWG